MALKFIMPFHHLQKQQFFLACIALVLLTFIAYEPMRKNDFVGYDDDTYITEHPRVVKGITVANIIWAFGIGNTNYYHPLAWLSHMLDCQLYGLNPTMHHLTSLIIHTVSSLLLFLIFRWMTGGLWSSAFVAALFALHPLNVESVAWATERKSILSTFFGILALLSYVSYTKRPGFLRYIFVIVVFMLGLLAKPMLVTLPFVFLLLDYWPLRRIDHGRFRGDDNSKINKSIIIRLVLEKIPLLVLSAVLICISSIALQQLKQFTLTGNIPMKLRVSNAFVSYVKYAGKMVWPKGLAVLYPFPKSVALWQSIGSLLLLTVVSVFVIRMSRKRRYLGVGWFWYVGTLVPVIGLVQAGMWPEMADRFAYVPLIGLFVVVAWGVPDLLAKFRYRKYVLRVSAVTIPALLLICTRIQVRHWRDDLALFGRAVAVTENNSIMHNNFANTLRAQGRYQEALIHFNEALRINPQYLRAYNNKGLTLYDMDRVEEAIEIFKELISNSKSWADPHNNLGLAYAKKGELDLAVQSYSEAIRLKSDYFKALNNLGVALKSQGKIEQAIEQWQKALTFKPDYAKAHRNLGLAFARQSKYDAAVIHFTAALKAEPDAAETYYNLGCVYYLQGKVKLAVAQLRKALQLKPDYLMAGTTLARTLFELGQVQPAIDTCYGILQYHPDQVEILNELAWILAAAGNSTLRNPMDAIRFAKRACEFTKFKQPQILDTLAVAYAASGEFPQAIETAEKAIRLAKSRGEKELAQNIENRLKLYKAGRAYFQPP